MTMIGRLPAVAALLLVVGATRLTAQRPATPPKPAATHEADEENEHTVPEAQVPAAVRDAFRRAYPHATASKWSTETENGHTVYEVESVDGATHRDLLISTTGTILETETQVTAAQLPGPVRTVAEAHGAHIERAELVVAGRDTTYEIKIQGHRGEMKLRSNGQHVPTTQH